MGWSIGFDTHWNRDIGYGVPAFCDHPHCSATIDRGLAYVCGGEPYGGDKGCGLYFCAAHLFYYRQRSFVQLCARCGNYKRPFTPKPEHPDWIQHKATDESWAQWRTEHPELVAAMNTTSGGGNQPVADSADLRAPRTVNTPARDEASSSFSRPPEEPTR